MNETDDEKLYAEEIHRLEADEVQIEGMRLAAAILLLQDRGIIPRDFDPARHNLKPVPGSNKYSVRRLNERSY